MLRFLYTLYDYMDGHTDDHKPITVPGTVHISTQNQLSFNIGNGLLVFLIIDKTAILLVVNFSTQIHDQRSISCAILVVIWPDESSHLIYGELGLCMPADARTNPKLSKRPPYLSNKGR